MHKFFGWSKLKSIQKFLIVTILAVIAIVTPTIVRAADNTQWEDVYDGLIDTMHYSNVQRQSWYYGNCIEEQAQVERYGGSETIAVCATHSQQASLASFLPSGSNVAQYALKKQGDTAYHLLTNVYSPAQPVLLSDNSLLTVSLSGQNNLKMISLNDVHLKLQTSTMQTGATTFSSVYAIDETQADIIHDANGSGVYTRHIAASHNSKFAAIEVYGVGIALVDLTAHSARLIATDKVSNYADTNSTIKLGVSNDGKKVFVTGNKVASHKVYLIDDFCGRNTIVGTDIEKPCDSIDLTDKIKSSLGARTPYHVDVSDDSREIAIYAWSLAEGNSSKITIKPDPNSLRLSYLALGDSYSSGEGDTEKNSQGQRYYRAMTNVSKNEADAIPEEKCHISTRSYPYILATGMHLALDNPRQWNTVACSNATAWDAKLQGSPDYLGQGDRLKNVDADTYKKNALRDFIPGRQKQIEFIKKYKPRAVTITMGGNDVGFGEKIGACATPITTTPTCTYANEDGRPGLGSQIRNQYDNLKSLYEELRSASAARTKIYVLGYPQFINGNEPAACGWNIGALNSTERRMIHESVAYLNDVIEQAARSVGVKYIDIENSLVGGRLCDDGQRFVTGVVGAGGELQESFHPNARGHYEMAMTVWDNTGSASLIDYDYCASTGENYCPDTNATKDAIVKPSYFAGSSTQPDTHYQHMTSGKQPKTQLMDIILGPLSFMANAIVNITIRSEPTDLGDFAVREDGSLDVNVAVPISLPAGYHTLIVTGQAPNGEQIRYEQIVQVLGSDPKDVDENGQVDDQQVCGPFMAVAGVDEDKDGVDDACDPIIEVTQTEPSPTVTPTSTPQPGVGNNSAVEAIAQVVRQIIVVIVTIVTSVLNLLKGLKFGLW